jgi:hypothetical protein
VQSSILISEEFCYVTVHHHSKFREIRDANVNLFRFLRSIVSLLVFPIYLFRYRLPCPCPKESVLKEDRGWKLFQGLIPLKTLKENDEIIAAETETPNWSFQEF